MNKKEFFSKNQFGFLSDRLTNNTLFLFNKFLHENLDCNSKTLDIFLDIKIAFDSVNHVILLKNYFKLVLEGTFIILYNHIRQIEHN